nr:MAG TPA: hypothetical protein [Bacteriophage sp.]
MQRLFRKDKVTQLLSPDRRVKRYSLSTVL